MSKDITLSDLASEFMADAVRKTGRTEFHYMETEPYIDERRPNWNPADRTRTMRNEFIKLVKIGCVERIKRGYYRFIKTKDTEIPVSELLLEWEDSKSRKKRSLIDTALDVMVDLVKKTGKTVFRGMDLIPAIKERRPDWNPKNKQAATTMRDLFLKADAAGFVKYGTNSSKRQDGYVEFVKTRDGKNHVDDLLQNMDGLNSKQINSKFKELFNSALTDEQIQKILDDLPEVRKQKLEALVIRNPNHPPILVFLSPWKFNGEIVAMKDFEKRYGFVYEIEFNDGKRTKYIGRKAFHRGTDPEYYYGSGLGVRPLMVGMTEAGQIIIIQRRMLAIEDSAKELADAEVQAQRDADAVERDDYLNKAYGDEGRDPKEDPEIADDEEDEIEKADEVEKMRFFPICVDDSMLTPLELAEKASVKAGLSAKFVKGMFKYKETEEEEVLMKKVFTF